MATTLFDYGYQSILLGLRNKIILLVCDVALIQ